MKVHFREQYGIKGEEFLYVTPLDQDTIVRVTIKGEKVARKFGFFKLFQKIFLPTGYPDSVSSDYLDYQKWDTLQAFASTISGTLTTHSILKGLGVGSAAATSLSATITWVLKEGVGHLGRIVFAYWKGTELDIDSKKWRLRADALNDIAMTIEIFLLPYYPKYSMYILCATTTMKSIVGVAGSATRSALTMHHALRGNFADVASKDSAQETCVNLIASFVGLFLLTGIKSTALLATTFIILTLIHIFANVRAVKSVCLNTFNEARYLIALEEFFRSGSILTPTQVNQLERVSIGQTVSLTAPVKIGCSVKDFTEQIRNKVEIENLIACFDSREKFLIAETKGYVGVFLHYDIKPHDILRAYFFVASYLQDRNQIRDNYWDVQTKWSEFLNMAQQEGWQVHSHLLSVDEYRIDWRFI